MRLRSRWGSLVGTVDQDRAHWGASLDVRRHAALHGRQRSLHRPSAAVIHGVNSPLQQGGMRLLCQECIGPAIHIARQVRSVCTDTMPAAGS